MSLYIRVVISKMHLITTINDKAINNRVPWETLKSNQKSDEVKHWNDVIKFVQVELEEVSHPFK